MGVFYKLQSREIFNRSVVDVDQRARRRHARWMISIPAAGGCWGFLGCCAAACPVASACTCCWWVTWPWWWWWCLPGLTPFLGGTWPGGDTVVHVTPGICGRPTGGLLASGELRHSSRNARSYTSRVPTQTTHACLNTLRVKERYQTLAITSPNINHFQNSFTVRLSRKFVTKSYLTTPTTS